MIEINIFMHSPGATAYESEISSPLLKIGFTSFIRILAVAADR